MENKNNDLYLNKYRISSMRLSNWDYASPGYYFVTICTYNKKLDFGEIKNNKMHLSPIGKIVKNYWREIPEHFKYVKLDAFIIMPNHLHGIIQILWNDNPLFANNNKKKLYENIINNICNIHYYLNSANFFMDVNFDFRNNFSYLYNNVIRFRTNVNDDFRRDAINNFRRDVAFFRRDVAFFRRDVACNVSTQNVSTQNVSVPQNVFIKQNIQTNKNIKNNTQNKNEFFSKISPRPGSLSIIIRSFKSACTKTIRKNHDPLFHWQSRFYDHVVRDKYALYRIQDYIIDNPSKWQLDKNNKMDLWM